MTINHKSGDKLIRKKLNIEILLLYGNSAKHFDDRFTVFEQG